MRLGSIKRDPSKVKKAWFNQRVREGAKFRPRVETVILRHYNGSYDASACVAGSKRRAPRSTKLGMKKCGHGHGKTPTTALKLALRSLAGRLR